MSVEREDMRNCPELPWDGHARDIDRSLERHDRFVRRAFGGSPQMTATYMPATWAAIGVVHKTTAVATTVTEQQNGIEENSLGPSFVGLKL